MNISKHKDGYRVIVQHQGQRRSAYAKTKAAAQLAGADLLVQMGGQLKPSTVSVAKLIATWQATREHSPTYAADVDRVVDRLPEHFTSRPLERVDAAVIDHLYRTLAKAGWSAHRIRRVHEVLRSSFKLALKYQWALTNPVTVIDPPSLPSRNIKPPSTDNVVRLLDAVKGTTLGLFLELSATTGARRGELVALKWDDINDQTVLIQRSMVYTPASGPVERDTKTGSKGHRSLAITAQSAEQLAALGHRQKVQALHVGISRPVWVFSHDSGLTPWLPGYPTLAFVRLCRTLGITGVRLHDLRHFVATQLLASGEAPTTVAHRLGHSTTATTLKTYAHYLLATDQRSADTMDRILNRG